MRRRAGHASAVDFLDAIGRSPRLQLVQVGEDLEAEALRWLRRHDEREYSFVDATSFAVMRARKIREALAFDGESNWLEGLLLLAVYVILAIAFYHIPETQSAAHAASVP